MSVSNVEVGHEGGRVLVSVIFLDGSGLRLRPTPDEADLIATQLITAAAHARTEETP